ncbi:MAG: roadblock/LC7 domain-containing protein [Gemmatimonadetes bacterium]|nr:roadblock/LC7 domain-containing protein [Gemmatimonadota bacterium]
MPTIRELVATLTARPGVEAAVLLGRDGLLIDGAGADGLGLDAAAAYVPALIASSEELSSAIGRGRLVAEIMEFERGFAIIATLTTDVVLLVLVRPGGDLGAIVGEIRRHRSHIAAIL